MNGTLRHRLNNPNEWYALNRRVTENNIFHSCIIFLNLMKAIYPHLIKVTMAIIVFESNVILLHITLF